MILSIDEVEALISTIVLGSKLEQVINGSGEKVFLCFRQPTRENILYSEYYHSLALKTAKEQGIPTIEEMDKLLVARGIWGVEQENEVKRLEQDLEAQKAVLAKTTKVVANRDRLQKIIDIINKKIRDVKRPRDIKLEHTAERKADEDKLLFLVWAGVFKPFVDTRYWITFEDFKDETDIVFRGNTALAYTNFFSGVKSSYIRYIARNPQWVVRYMAAQKNGGKLFPREVYDYSNDMLHLMYWSSFYSSLNEMMPEDRPEDDIIEDDDALDTFMDRYFKEKKSDVSEARHRKRSGKKVSALDHNEVLVMRSNPMYEDVEYSALPNRPDKNKGSVEVVEKKR